MPRLLSSTAAFFFVLLLLQVIRSQEPILHYKRLTNATNTIVLGCADAYDDILRPGALFYRGGEVLYKFGESVGTDPNRVVANIQTNKDKEIVFNIDRSAEGRYSCALSSSGSISQSVDIIG